LRIRTLHYAASVILAIALVLDRAAAEAYSAGLDGVDWQLRQFRVGESMREPAVERAAVLRFDDGRLSGNVGCNQLIGAYHADGDKLMFEPRVASTMMACPPLLMEQERAVIEAIGKAASYHIAGGLLSIADADGQTLMTFSERKSLPLTGTSWRLTHYNNGKQAIVSVLNDTRIMLQLRDDGQLAGKACNAYRSGFQRDGDRLQVVGPIAATRMACPGPAGATEQEAAYFAALERVAGFRISGDVLTLIDDQGTTMAKFRAAGDSK
jgi:heat shock protein HslJ